MNENRRQILNMLAASKITAEEAEPYIGGFVIFPFEALETRHQRTYIVNHFCWILT